MNEQLDRIEKKTLELDAKLDATHTAVHKVLVYIRWTGIITVAVIVIPLFIIPFFVPSFLASQGFGTINSLGL